MFLVLMITDEAFPQAKTNRRATIWEQSGYPFVKSDSVVQFAASESKLLPVILGRGEFHSHLNQVNIYLHYTPAFVDVNLVFTICSHIQL